MTQDEIIEMARQAGYFLYDLTETHGKKTVETDEDDEWAQLEAYTKLVAAKERERIIAANAPELEKVNAHIKRLEDQAYDLLGQLKVANIKLSMRPQRTWVGLTPEEILDMFDDQQVYGSKWLEFARAVENKLKEKNNA